MQQQKKKQQTSKKQNRCHDTTLKMFNLKYQQCLNAALIRTQDNETLDIHCLDVMTICL